MTAAVIALCIVCQLLIVAGQLLLKHAINSRAATAAVRSRAVRHFVLGIAILTLWFFLWLGLMRRWDLSKLYPFEGLNPAMMAIGAWLVLKERLPARAWVGLVLVCVGIVFVARS